MAKENRINIRIDDNLRARVSKALEVTGLDEPVLVRTLLQAFVETVELHGRIILPLEVSAAPTPLVRLKRMLNEHESLLALAEAGHAAGSEASRQEDLKGIRALVKELRSELEIQTGRQAEAEARMAEDGARIRRILMGEEPNSSPAAAPLKKKK